MKKQGSSKNQAKIVYLAIGSNLSNKKYNIEKTKFKLLKYDIKIVKCSSNYESLSWPNPKKPKFVNLVVKIKTTLSPINLLKICHTIEKQMGRKRFKKTNQDYAI